MPRDTRHVLTGILRTSALGLYLLETDDGGVWQLDVGWGRQARRLTGRRVRIVGTRSGHDMLDVQRMEAV